MDLEKYLYEKVCPILRSWDEKGIYAISFYVNYDETTDFYGIKNFPEFSVGYNTEADCDGESLYSEARWNYAFWCQNNIAIVDTIEAVEGAEALVKWYRSKGIENAGEEENEDSMYDDNMKYIGKGPAGFYEFVGAVTNVAGRIQQEGIVREQFGSIPILIHDLEYS